MESLRASLNTATLEIQRLQPASPKVASPVKRTFESSKYRIAYHSTAVPTKSFELLKAVHDLIEQYCVLHSLDSGTVGDDFYHRLEREAMRNGTTLVTDLDVATQFLWSSALTLDPSHPKEFCSIINSALYTDNEKVVAPVAVIVRALNRLIDRHPLPSGAPLPFPPGGECWRGGGFDDSKQSFFTVGRQYRVPSYLATSFAQATAQLFKDRAVMAGGHSGVLWRVLVDPRGATEYFKYRCKNACHIQHTLTPGEEEYLFAPYSVFTVVDVVWSANPTNSITPHRITIVALTDNLEASSYLPLAPWS
jgi:hypothetical protein